MEITLERRIMPLTGVALCWDPAPGPTSSDLQLHELKEVVFIVYQLSLV